MIPPMAKMITVNASPITTYSINDTLELKFAWVSLRDSLPHSSSSALMSSPLLPKCLLHCFFSVWWGLPMYFSLQGSLFHNTLLGLLFFSIVIPCTFKEKVVPTPQFPSLLKHNKICCCYTSTWNWLKLHRGCKIALLRGYIKWKLSTRPQSNYFGLQGELVSNFVEHVVCGMLVWPPRGTCFQLCGACGLRDVSLASAGRMLWNNIQQWQLAFVFHRLISIWALLPRYLQQLVYIARTSWIYMPQALEWI